MGMMTVRKCGKCNYETLICNDNLKRKKVCRYCRGLMKIIMKEKKK